MLKTFTEEDIFEMPKRYRTQFINSITGFKSVCLVGTQSEKSELNLAIFSQIFHLGANPPLIGMIVRPAFVPRHTWTNIQETKYFTLNHIHPSFVDKAHQTSAKYPAEISEFKATGLTSEFYPSIKAPFVKESHLKIGLEYKESKLIEINETILVIGQIKLVEVNDEVIKDDGFVDLAQANTITAGGLDAYYTAKKVARFNYAQPNIKLENVKDSLF